MSPLPPSEGHGHGGIGEWEDGRQGFRIKKASGRKMGGDASLFYFRLMDRVYQQEIIQGKSREWATCDC